MPPQSQPDPRKSQAWRRLSVKVAGEEPVCWLRLPGCTYWSTEGDHVLPVDTHPELCLVRSNVRGACRHCNAKRGNAPPPPAATRRPDALDIFD